MLGVTLFGLVLSPTFYVAPRRLFPTRLSGDAGGTVPARDPEEADA